MDLTQNKLTRTEWNGIEVPVSEGEKRILKLIIDSASTDVNMKTNDHLSMIQFLKLEKTIFNESFLYNKYFQTIVNTMVQKYKTHTGIYEMFLVASVSIKDMKMVKKADIIRIENMNIITNRPFIFEFVLMDLCEHLLDKLMVMEKTYKITKTPSISLKNKPSNDNNIISNHSYVYYLYTLIQFKKLSINNINKYVAEFVDSVIQYAKTKTRVSDIVHSASQTIEQNPYLLKYEDMSLYDHQKKLFTIASSNPTTPKLILYTAPTGTGKTLSPVGLLNNYRVIFVCVARHVGLALAKAAISVEKKIAFAFGCETASDIRLHYFAATDYVRNNRTGAIAKVDNSIGDKVEMIICDVKSYLVAMRYMLAFNKESKIITYWDEPTITMDYENHELHELIHKNWVENKISKMVLSCATLPKEEEIASTIIDFQCRFENAEIHNIRSYDCKKTISLLNKESKCVLPHLLFASYDDVEKCVKHCEDNKSLLRYFDLQEIIRFVEYVNKMPDALPEHYSMSSYFGEDIANITMHSLKMYYLEVLKKVDATLWSQIFIYMVTSQPILGKSNIMQQDQLRKLKSMEQASSTPSQSIVRSNSIATPIQSTSVSSATTGVLITTEDAHTLTDGPTIYLAEDIQKIGQFCIQQTKIPQTVLTGLLEKIENNNCIQKRIDVLDKNLEDKLGKEIEKSKKMEREQFSGEVRNVMNEINGLRQQIQNVTMEQVYIPNTKQHQHFWTKNENIIQNAFVPRIEESVVKEIMLIEVETNMKLLLLLGIGMFDKNTNIDYMEVMKRLADEQKLFLIIAGSDYIYGTNYQFCHGFIGKDLQNMTQQKIIQAMGRIGRNNIQQDYSVRFRDNEILASLFLPSQENREAVVMSRLFSCEDE